MRTKSTAKRRSKAIAKRRPVTALARRPKTLPKVLPLKGKLDDLEQRALTESIQLGQLGLVEVKLTPAEELVLSEPAPVADYMVKPNGAVYLSHPVYTRWLNRAFGRMGWALVPASRPMKSDGSVVCPYVLYIHGQPAAFAMGEQEYFENNRDQSYGDALESTVASALRRCCKRLGIGLELWDKHITEAWLDRYTVRVQVENKHGEKVWQVRKRDAPPFWREVGRSRGQNAPSASQAARHESPRAGKPHESSHPQVGSPEPITGPQAMRLDVIVRNSGRTDEEVDLWLQRRFGFANRKAVTRGAYDVVWKSIEASGSLPEA